MPADLFFILFHYTYSLPHILTHPLHVGLPLIHFTFEQNHPPYFPYLPPTLILLCSSANPANNDPII